MLNEKQIKLNIGAKQHHYSMFNVERSMFDVHLLICSMFIFFSKLSTVLRVKKNNLAFMGYNRLRVLRYYHWNT
jgi:hypothetical protein